MALTFTMQIILSLTLSSLSLLLYLALPMYNLSFPCNFFLLIFALRFMNKANIDDPSHSQPISNHSSIYRPELLKRREFSKRGSVQPVLLMKYRLLGLRERDRQTDRQTKKNTERENNRERTREKNREGNRERQR